jgi:hypothetical protein
MTLTNIFGCFTATLWSSNMTIYIYQQLSWLDKPQFQCSLFPTKIDPSDLLLV